MAVSTENLDGEWSLQVDPENIGLDEEWWSGPPTRAIQARVPGIIQEVCPGYHGIAWYWKDFHAPGNPDPGGRYLLRFGAIDYAARVWLNGREMGSHEGGETPFTMDVTSSLVPESTNCLCVRVLNPTNERIDDFALSEIPHRNKVVPFRPGGSYNYGGITEGVELILTPPVYIEDIFVRADPESGVVEVETELSNSLKCPAEVRIEWLVAPASGGRTLARVQRGCNLRPGKAKFGSELHLSRPRIWDLHDPYLYRVTVALATHGHGDDETSVRCGFRDFRVRDGYFHLNGRRIFIRSTHTGNHCPVGQIIDPPGRYDLLRRDLVLAKACGFNMVRFISGVAHPRQLDLCDEIGLLVYEESLAAWNLGDSPKMKRRFEDSLVGMVRRDRNHPSLVIWGLLNETRDGPVFQEAVESLDVVRDLDDTRLVLLGSGRWDGRFEIGSVSNPGSRGWELAWGAEEGAFNEALTWPQGGYANGAGDAHVYPSTPQTDEATDLIRGLGEANRPVFLSEYGIGSLLNAIREARKFEERGFNPDLEDSSLMHSMADAFLADWNSMGFDQVYPFPEDMLRESQRIHCRQRLIGFDAIRSNPRICGFNLTGMLDHGMTGEGLWTFWREFKPGIVDALADGWAPLRWCLFVRPSHGYVGGQFGIEVVLANEAVLPPGDYPARIRVAGEPGIVWEKRAVVQVAKTQTGDAPLSQPVLRTSVGMVAPEGRYQLAAELEKGGAPAGGRLPFYVTDPDRFPRADMDVEVWGLDDRILQWLRSRGARDLAFPGSSTKPSIILVGRPTPSPDEHWKELVQRVAEGSSVLLLNPNALGTENAGLPFSCNTCEFGDWLYHKECVAKPHPIFEDLPKGIMDWEYYGPVISHTILQGGDPPGETVAAAFALGYPIPGGYASGTLIGIYRHGKGVFLVNTLGILDNLGVHPTADRLLLNMLKFAAACTGSA